MGYSAEKSPARSLAQEAAVDNFTPIPALVGGLLIGTAAALLLVLNGRIAGISGIVGGLLQGDRRDAVWRIAFLSGLIIAPILYVTFGGHLPAVSINSSAVLLVLAGLLVGFGTRLAAGCTSGHGVCGIGRGSPRSVVATGVFLAVAIATVFVVRQLGG